MIIIYFQGTSGLVVVRRLLLWQQMTLWR